MQYSWCERLFCMQDFLHEFTCCEKYGNGHGFNKMKCAIMNSFGLILFLRFAFIMQSILSITKKNAKYLFSVDLPFDVFKALIVIKFVNTMSNSY